MLSDKRFPILEGKTTLGPELCKHFTYMLRGSVTHFGSYHVANLANEDYPAYNHYDDHDKSSAN